MLNINCIVIGVVLCVLFVLVARQRNMRIEKELLQIELLLRKEENRRLEIMTTAIMGTRKTQ